MAGFFRFNAPLYRFALFLLLIAASLAPAISGLGKALGFGGASFASAFLSGLRRYQVATSS